MSNQIDITGGARVRGLNGVITGTTGVLNSLPINSPNGIPQLDSSGKILVSQLPNSVMEYKGTWNVSTNTPTLVNGTGNQGDVYLVEGAAVGGTSFNFGAGGILFFNGDQAIYSGSIWQRASGATGSVTSVGLSTNAGAITISNSPITTSGVISANFNGTNLQYVNGAGNLTTFPTLMTSVGLTMPTAFTVSNSPLTGAGGTIAVTGAGTASQYIRGDGQLATMPSGGGGGGSAVYYYLNGSIAASVATYKQMSNTAVIGTGTDFNLTGNGLIAQFLTDIGNPNKTTIPSGAWNFEMFFSMSSTGGLQKFYVELLKYNGSTFTTIASTSANPEAITGGTTTDLYITSLAVPETVLLTTDRLAIRVYIIDNSGGRTATLHTEDSNLCQITTTFTAGINSINGLNTNTQFLAVGTTGTDFNINSLVDTHTFNLPTASATKRGALSSADWTIFNNKQDALGFTPISLTSLSATTPLAYNNTTGAFSIQVANTTQSGYLSTTDWNTFKDKVNGSFTAGKVPFAVGSNSLGDTQLNYNGGNFGFGVAASTYRIDVSGSVNVTGNYFINGVAISLGGVTSVTATAPLSSSGGATPDISIAKSTGTVDGYLSAADWTIFNAKQDNLTFYSPLVKSGVSVTIPQATGTVDGFLDSADWTTFNNKQNALTNPVTGTGTNNYLAKFTTTGSTIGNSLIYDNGTNVGIGTISPNSKLEVTSRITASDGGGASRLALNIESNTSATAYSAINSYNYGTAAGRPLAINESGGNVMINTTTDAGYKLHVAGTVSSTNVFRSTNGFMNSYEAYNAWELGVPVSTSGLTLKTTSYVTVRINGNVYKLATVN